MNKEESAYLTALPGVAQGAGAAVRAQAIHTYSSMQTWMRITLIDLMETEGASEAHGTQAREGINPIHACPTVETGARKQTEDRTGKPSLPTCCLKM